MNRKKRNPSEFPSQSKLIWPYLQAVWSKRDDAELYLSNIFLFVAYTRLYFLIPRVHGPSPPLPPPSQQATMEAMEEAPPQSRASKTIKSLQGKCQLGMILGSDYTAPFSLWSTCLHPGWVSHSRSRRRCSASCEVSLVHAAEIHMGCMAFGCLTACAKDGWVTLGKCKSFRFTYTIVTFKEKKEKTCHQQTHV